MSVFDFRYEEHSGKKSESFDHSIKSYKISLQRARIEKLV